MARFHDENGWELFEHDFDTNRTTWMTRDDLGRPVFRVDQVVDPLMQANAFARSEAAGQRWGGGRRVASVPANHWFRHLKEAQSQKDEKYLRKWLNDGDNAAFRTFEGRC